jgi:glycosyltransferase involved in cell wall biosynthesis
MRIGTNPSKQKPASAYRPARVTIAVLVYIPELTGYFHHRLDILKLCLESLLKHTEEPYDLLVFDNGSCAEVIDYLRSLRDDGTIHYLILSSRNIGKIGAFQVIFRAALGEIVAYCDDDVFFYPGWLPAHLKILETFPKVGMVSGWAIRHTFGYGNQSCLAIADTDTRVTLERTRCIPNQWEVDFAISTGRKPEKYLADTAEMQDILLHCEGVPAFATADHFQFVSPKSVVLEGLPDSWSGKLMGQMLDLDEAIDGAGYLRLSTRDRYVRHMGNVITEDLQVEAEKFGLQTAASEVSQPRSFWRNLAQKPWVKHQLKALYDRLHWLLYVELRKK